MSSMPCLPHHTTSHVTDLQTLFQTHSQNPFIGLTSQPTKTKTGLKYFNMRVTQRLHRYRSMKKNWREVAASMQSMASPLATGQPPDASSPSQDFTKKLTGSSQKSVIESSDCPNATAIVPDIRERSSSEPDILHTRIQQDLMKLRRLIKHKRRKFNDNVSFVSAISTRPIGATTSIPATFDNQQHSNGKTNKEPSPSSFISANKLKPLDHVKVAGCQMRSSTLPKSDSIDSGLGTTSNSSSTCSHYPKHPQQQNPKRQSINKTFSICQSQVHLPSSHASPLPPDSSPLQASPSSKKKANTSSKPTPNGRSKQTLPSRLALLIPQIPAVVKKKQPSFTKQEIRAEHTRRLSVGGDVTTRLYTYAAPSSSIAPHSIALKRNTSLLPILLKSSSCIGLPTREIDLKKFEYGSNDEQEENDTNGDNADYYHLLDYKHLINDLPKSVVSIRPRKGQDDYGILFDQLAHIRERMPDSNTYDEYTRTA